MNSPLANIKPLSFDYFCREPSPVEENNDLGDDGTTLHHLHGHLGHSLGSCPSSQPPDSPDRFAARSPVSELSAARSPNLDYNDDHLDSQDLHHLQHHHHHHLLASDVNSCDSNRESAYF